MSILWAYELILSPPSLRSAIDLHSAPLPLNPAGAIPPSMASALSLAFDSVWFGFLLPGFCLPCALLPLHFSFLPLALMMALRSARVSAPGGACPFSLPALCAGASRRPVRRTIRRTVPIGPWAAVAAKILEGFCARYYINYRIVSGCQVRPRRLATDAESAERLSSVGVRNDGC